jgi:hypothetical protein
MRLQKKDIQEHGVERGWGLVMYTGMGRDGRQDGNLTAIEQQSCFFVRNDAEKCRMTVVFF